LRQIILETTIKTKIPSKEKQQYRKNNVSATKRRYIKKKGNNQNRSN